MNRAEKRRQKKLAKKTARKTKPGQSIDLGVAHHSAGRLAEAERIYRAILQADPNQPVALHLLGVIMFQQGDTAGAAEQISQALAILPDYAEAHFNLGNALKKLNRLEEAQQSYQKAIAIKDDYAEAFNNLGLVEKDLNQLDDAAASYRQALAIKDDFAQAHNNLGFVLSAQNQLQPAAACYQKALALRPDYGEVHYNLGNLLIKNSQLDMAEAHFRKALARKADYAEAHSNLIFLQDFMPDIDQGAQQAERKLWDDKFILPLAATPPHHANSRTPDRPLRIGYVSADFRDHSAELGFGPLIMEHDRQNFEVICYDATILKDHVNQALQAAATDWRDINNIDDEQLAKTIKDDAIDILVDLSGHTRGNRLKAFGHTPAPVQVTGIGHLAAGISTIDYRLTTPQMTPPGEQDIYPEMPIYLDTYFGFTPPTGAPPVGPPPCLTNDFITFGFLGRFIKISDQVLAVWATILHAVPGARLLLKYSQLDDPATRQKLMDTFSGLGIDGERLILLGQTVQAAHLMAHNRVDMVLDSFPQGGGMTTMDSLWMGVPVIGLCNPKKAGGRIIDCICAPVGLGDWVARNVEDYRALALGWSGRCDELAHIRSHLRQRVADVYCRFPRDVEKSYRLIWQRWCAGRQVSPLYPLSTKGN